MQIPAQPSTSKVSNSFEQSILCVSRKLESFQTRKRLLSYVSSGYVFFLPREFHVLSSNISHLHLLFGCFLFPIVKSDLVGLSTLVRHCHIDFRSPAFASVVLNHTTRERGLCYILRGTQRSDARLLTSSDN